ncbi:MAG: hypothetical protein JRI23_05970 [Deltaproteobacteria bacterium]|jgi:hypothetical protein|nr:hypothetical protein [Deltaproteobacteria bacterium]MBW2531110.1 hypothetical protein [Deltaproteobacteria bacterium]
MGTRWMILGLAAGCALSLAAACGGGDDDLGGELAAGGQEPIPQEPELGGGDPGETAPPDIDGDLGTGVSYEGCAKVDFLFVVDNSISMRDQQAALIASFPGFMSAIEATLTADDYHIMVVDTDDKTRCTKANCTSGDMNANELCVQPAGGYACNTTFEACDKKIGAGVVHPAGKGASNQPCTVYGGNRYIVQGEPDLVGTFSCMAKVGLAGHYAERPMDSLVAAVSPEMNSGCNDGFLRDDAILVVTFISDDPWYEDAGTPQDWYDAVVAAKNGDPESVVVLGLTPNYPECRPNAEPPKGAHWSEFVAMWGERGLEGSVCSDDYAGFFAQAISVIDDTCDDFEPPE